MAKFFTLTLSHTIVGMAGFALGIYALPILTAPSAPSVDQMAAASGQVLYQAEFKRDLKDSDFLHWGEGRLLVGRDFISLKGELAPGPNYILYLSPQFVETEDDFKRLKPQMTAVGDVRTFENFIVSVPEGVDPSQYTSAIVWCESFDQFITAAKYR